MAPDTVKNLVFSFIRTIVPAAVTYLIGIATENFGPVISENTKAQLVALGYAVAFTLYYLITRLLETYVSPHFSWLLGDFRKGSTQPVYPDATETTIVPPSDTPVAP